MKAGTLAELVGSVVRDNPDVTVAGPFLRTEDPENVQYILYLPNGYGLSFIPWLDERYGPGGTFEMMAGHAQEAMLRDGTGFISLRFPFILDGIREVEGENRHRIDAVLTELRTLPDRLCQ